MTHFTAENTEGFTADELNAMNKAFEYIAARFDIEESNIADKVSNAYYPDATWEGILDALGFTSHPSCLNEQGQEHVKSELSRLGLDWDHNGTFSDIEAKIEFSGLVKGCGDQMDYEISNFAAGKNGYGVFAYITIEADKHVRFERGE